MKSTATTMKKVYLFISILLTTASIYANTATDSIPLNKTTPHIIHGPYIQAVNDNSFTVVWTTDCETIGWVEIAPNDNTHFYYKARPKYYDSRFGLKQIGKLHTVQITGLNTGTTYRYRVMQKSVLSNQGINGILYGKSSGTDVFAKEPYQVTTLDAKKKTISFSIVNDMHSHDSILRILYKDIKPKKYDFVCFNGDMTNHIRNTEHIFTDYMNSAITMFANNTPLYMVRGNHEYRGFAANTYMDYFPTTTGFPYYTFRDGPVFFIVLDSGEDKADSDIEYYGLYDVDSYRIKEREWLKNIVKSEAFKSAPIKIVFSHIPPNPKGWHGDAEISKLFVPILNKAKINLMLCGHIHQYRYDRIGKTNCNFPIVCNANLERMDVTANSKKIEIKTYNDKGIITHTLSFTK